MKDKFWNFVFYKFIFVFGVVNVQYLNEVRPCLQIKIHRVYLCNMWLARNHGLINPPLSTGGSLGVVVHRVVLFALALATLQRPIRIRKSLSWSCDSHVTVFLSALLLHNNPWLVPLQTGHVAFCDPDPVRDNVYHLHWRWPVWWN